MNQQIIIFIGASECSGYGLRKELSYVSKFSEMIKQDDLRFTVKNISFPGAATTDGKEMLHPILNRTDSIHSIFISLGLSDAVYGVNPNQIYQNFLGINEVIKALHPETKIYIMEGEIFQYNAIPNLPIHSSTYYLEYKKMYRKLYQNKNIKVYPFLMESFLNQSDYFLSDKVHPNDKGTSVMANIIYKYFIEINK